MMCRGKRKASKSLSINPPTKTRPRQLHQRDLPSPIINACTEDATAAKLRQIKMKLTPAQPSPAKQRAVRASMSHNSR
ncbi:hypothetical protein Pmani_027461 [Petrolisthes manimaculis]|uniref:Uncharacterized protein n=1 Tax=Petrolisthes manimaculis TaxID=1843537 RepID=A0AAE1TZ14_9EUCA|nr:hypothetical protein Pmani_027461 [Petrolisthes manimaculis]